MTRSCRENVLEGKKRPTQTSRRGRGLRSEHKRRRQPAVYTIGEGKHKQEAVVTGIEDLAKKHSIWVLHSEELVGICFFLKTLSWYY